MKVLQKINRFYLILIILMAALSVLVIVVLRVVFNAISLSQEFDEGIINAQTPHLDKGKINETLEKANKRQTPKLDLL